MIGLRKNKRFFLLILTLFLLLPSIYSIQANASSATFSDVVWAEENHSTARETADAASSENVEVDQGVAESFQDSAIKTIQGGGQALQLSPTSNSASFSRHIMCKDFDIPAFNPINPTTIFRPSDTKAVCLTTVSINNTIEFRWYYRSNASWNWVSCYNWSRSVSGVRHEASWLFIAGYWPGYNYPRAYKVEVYLDASPSSAFSEFFEVTNGGLNSPRMCKDVDVNGQPVNMTSRFTIGNDTKAHHYLRFDKMAYFNEELGYSHNFTTVWIQPDGTINKTYSGDFSDYKDTNVTWNYWEYNYTRDDYIIIDPSTLVGNWTVETYLDRYFDNTWMRYGPIATTPFIVGNETVADWTFMVYLDADNNLEPAGIDIFDKMAEVASDPQVNIVVQMDRIPGYDHRYGNWTDAKRFNVTKDMWPSQGNATVDLGEVNMGHPATLWDFINWTIYAYPANYYSLVLWDHGTGCMGFCFDMSTSPSTDLLTLPELNQALSGLPAIIDVALFDLCSMSMIEVSYQVKDYVNVLVGPEGLGYAPAPYDNYLSSLISNSSMLPSAFAKKVVTDYIDWCVLIDEIQNATMSATDLTEITSLMAAIDDFALTLKEKETPYFSLLLASHEQITLARNLTEGYTGPYAGQSGYYIDLYHFAQLINQSVLDEELRNTADQVVTALESTIILGANKARPDSHGLSIFFPDEKGKYDSFGSKYEEITFAKDTPWDEFVKYHLSGYILTIKTPYPDIPVKIDEESYTTDTDGKIRVFVLPDSYTVNVTTPVETVPGSRGVFRQWNDSDTSNPKTVSVDTTLTLEAEYTIQYYVTIDHFGSAVTQNASVDLLSLELPIDLWWTEGSTHNVSVSSTISDGSDTRYIFTQWNDDETTPSRTITVTASTTYTAYYKTQYIVTFSQSGVGTDYTGTFVTVGGKGYNVDNLPLSLWWDNGTTLNFAFQSPLVVTPDAERYVWTSTGGLSSLKSDSITASTSGNITGNYTTQYYLTIRTDPTGISPLPNVSPPGPWYNNGTLVNCTAQEIAGRAFDYWTLDGARWDPGVDTITVTMDGPCEATAHYVRERSWWEILLSLESLNLIIALVGLVITVALLGVAWIRTRKRRTVTLALLSKIDDAYSKFKLNPPRCEEELHRLRSTISKDLADGKITQECYDLMDKKIEEHLEELRKQ